MIMRAADKINFTTTQTAAYVMNQYPAEWWQKVCIIPNGYNSNLLDAIDRPPRTHSRLRLVYTGSLSMQRSPETFLRALQHLNQSIPLANQLEVLFVGRGAKSFHRIVEELQLTSIVSLHDPLPIRESLQLAASADVFLVLETLTGNDSIMLHAKIVDYLMLHKPILGVVSPVGAMAELLQRLHYPVVMPNDMTMIATAISRLLESWKAGTLKPAPTHEQVAREYDIRHTTARLDAELRSIL
jgi:glycosyltransferase involved in cell wall biosynthesis